LSFLLLRPGPIIADSRFPLNSTTKIQRKAADAALDSFAISSPLLEGHEVPSMCPDAPKKTWYNMDGVERLKDHPHVVTRFAASLGSVMQLD
jgi:hypothetical protein